MVSMKGVTRRHCLLVFLLIGAAQPSFVHAQVVIDEIMYNPKGSDSGREWIELENLGASDVTMIGGTVKGSWRVNDGSNHTLTDPSGGVGRGTLTIPAGGYLVIASDPSDFISGEYAGGSYSAVKSSISLSNSGASVSLVDGTGTTVDTASYTSAQGGADDGSSLQKQTDGTWIAALPTPGAANSSTPYVAPVDTTAQSAGDSTQSASTSDQSQPQTPAVVESSYVPPPTPSLYADAGKDMTVIVGADVEFDANAYDKNQNMMDPSTVRFSWNFGDGVSAEGPSVLHHFSYPGRYAVILDIANNKNAASDEITVTAEPAALSFDLLQDGGVNIDNRAGHDLDLSDWIVREDSGSFSSQFILPDHSEILAGSSMNISTQTLQFRASSSTLLEYPNGATALSIGETVAPAAAQAQEGTPSAAPAEAGAAPPAPIGEDVQSSVEPDNSMQADSPAASADASVATATSVLATSTQLAAASSGFSKRSLWWLAALALAALAGSALVASNMFKKHEWDIIEEKGN